MVPLIVGRYNKNTDRVSDPSHRIARVDFLRPRKLETAGRELSRPEKINECDPVTRIRHEGSIIFIIYHTYPQKYPQNDD